MKKNFPDNLNWIICKDCFGRGKTSQRLKKKVRLNYKKEMEQFLIGNSLLPYPVKPKSHLLSCQKCDGSGLVLSITPQASDFENYPKIAIIGAGIGGVAFAVACLHRAIPFTLYERDTCFEARAQGYGLTLQQANKAISGLGIFELKEGVVSTKHIVHTTDGKVIGEWGMRKWLISNKLKLKKNTHTNIHISRQALRLEFLERLGGTEIVQWGRKLISLNQNEKNVELGFENGNDVILETADLVVGADGIRSMVRKLSLHEADDHLRYLGCMVILGICPLIELQHLQSDLLDSKTVFQTANGTERIYIMPYDTKNVMWQLSFPMLEKDAKDLSQLGNKALKSEAKKRTLWHSPIPEILSATNPEQITGYPCYDRELLTSEMLANLGKVTLIGDSAHPMSPFKGQGANQAILDALALAREISKSCRSTTNWREKGIRHAVLNTFETEMLDRTAVKVRDSADAVNYLHSNDVLNEVDAPRGKGLNQKE